MRAVPWLRCCEAAVSDDIQTWSAQLASDPGSLVFLPLAEALRRRGQLDAALAVAQGGVSRYPELADAHDLLGRIRSDRGDTALAQEAWTNALRLQPDLVGAHKGLGYLCYRAGDLQKSLRHLESAMELVPDDSQAQAALQRVRGLLAQPLRPAVGDPFEGGEAGTLLVDSQGRRLGGVMLRSDGTDASDAMAAELSGVSREARRTVRLLGLGEWHSLYLETPGMNLVMQEPRSETLLVLARGPEVPVGRLPLLADRATTLARRWMDKLG